MAAVLPVVLASPAASGAVTLETEAPEFKGAVIKVHGKVEPGESVIIKAVSPEDTVTYRFGSVTRKCENSNMQEREKYHMYR